MSANSSPHHGPDAHAEPAPAEGLDAFSVQDSFGAPSVDDADLAALTVFLSVTQDNYATSNAQLITITQYPQNATVQTLTPMHYQRGFHTAVVVPDGKVYIFGGQVTVLVSTTFGRRLFQRLRAGLMANR